MVAKESALEVEEEDKILAKKVGKQKESGREVRRENYGEERRQADRAERDSARMNRQGKAKEKYKGKENGSKIMTW